MARAIDADSFVDDLLLALSNANADGNAACVDIFGEFIGMVKSRPTLTPQNEPLTPYPDGDMSIIACPRCGSGEYLHNEDGNEQNFCGQCGQRIDWSRPPEGEEDA